MTELRRRFRTAGVQYVVVKNTLAQRAFAANGIDALDDHLAGPTGLVLSGGDPVAGAKVLSDFAKEFEKPASQDRVGRRQAGDAGAGQTAGEFAVEGSVAVAAGWLHAGPDGAVRGRHERNVVSNGRRPRGASHAA